MTAIQWIGKPSSAGGVTERRFDLEHETRIVPGILWTPTQPEQSVPLVLIGHGGSGHKRSERQLLLGRHFAAVSQIAAVAIDGPFHGDRIAQSLKPHQYQEMMAIIGSNKVVDDMIGDWCATLDTIGQLDIINTDRIAYIGLSMGTRFGLPFVAATGSRLSCAVLGKNGMRSPAGMNMALRFTQDAPKINVPILFHVQWDDELFPRDGQFELFNLLGTHDKRLIAFPGSHNAAAPAAIQAWCEFITQHLVR
jgi:dienelactone hydrolase